MEKLFMVKSDRTLFFKATSVQAVRMALTADMSVREAAKTLKDPRLKITQIVSLNEWIRICCQN